MAMSSILLTRKGLSVNGYNKKYCQRVGAYTGYDLVEEKMTEVQKDLTKKLINQLTIFLAEDKFKEALSFFNDSSYDDVIKESSWDILPVVSSHLTTQNAQYNADKIECCKAILNAVIEKCNPSETVLALLEQMEDSENDVRFCIILNVLNKCLFRMDDKMKAIEWCISTIKSYMDGLTVPEKDSINENVGVNKIQNVYNAVLLFLKPLVDEAASNRLVKCAMLRDYLASILIFLMGKPLCCLQDKQLKLDTEPSLPEQIVTLLSSITGDLLSFLSCANSRSKKIKSKKMGMEEESTNLKATLFESSESISDLAYGNFYFYVITKLDLWERVPQVYDSKYVFEASIYLIIKLLQEQETVGKGLSLLEQQLKKITRRSLVSQLLELNIYLELIDALIKVMVYHSSDKERKKALNVFQEYIEIFDMEARYFIILRLYQISEHSGLLSLTTGIFKASIIECLQATPPIHHFLGSNLESLIKLACKLPHGGTSDLVELSDEIITSLNLLRFLFLRDKQNETGIWNLVDKLQDDYLKPLREGLDLCRAHWKVKIKDLEMQNKTHKVTENIDLENGDAEVTLMVGGEKLPAMPVAEKISFCHQALNGLDVIESILIRVNECIANNPLK